MRQFFLWPPIGVSLQEKRVKNYSHTIKFYFIGFIGVLGSLCPNTVHLISPLSYVLKRRYLWPLKADVSTLKKPFQQGQGPRKRKTFVEEKNIHR